MPQPYGAELLGAEEAFDSGQLVRGVVASFKGVPMENRYVESVMDVVPCRCGREGLV